jgi:hypothetical protein
MSTMVGLRGLARQTKFDIGGKSFVSGKTTWLNVDNPRVARDLQRHSAIGQSVQVGAPFYSPDDGVVLQGCVASGTAVAGQIAVSAGVIQTAAGASVTVPAANITVTDPATNPSLSLIMVNTSNGALAELQFTGVAGLTAVRALDWHETYVAGSVPASRIVIAHVFTPAVLAAIPATDIRDTRP